MVYKFLHLLVCVYPQILVGDFIDPFESVIKALVEATEATRSP